MNEWSWFAVITVAVLMFLVAYGLRDVWVARREAQIRAVAAVFTDAFGEVPGDEYRPGRNALAAGWTVQDMRLFAGLADPRWGEDYGSAVNNLLAQVLEPASWPGQTVRERIVWAYALIGPGERPALRNLDVPPEVMGAPLQRQWHTLAAARRWHRACGVAGAYALAAGLSYAEAVDAARTGDLDPGALATLAALGGHRMPTPEVLGVAA